VEVPKILKKTTIKTKHALMTYLSAFLFMFAFTILAYSIASFLMNRFPQNPNAILFVGVILGVSSFFAIFIDIFWSYLQKIYPPKKLTIWALIGLIITVSIFFLSDFGPFVVFRWTIFTFIAAFLYGWSFDLYDVTITTLVIKKSEKENLAQNISQKKVFEALGMICGLLVAGFLVIFSSAFAQFVLIIFLIFVTIFFSLHFDQQKDSNEKLEFAEYTLINWKSVFANLTNKEKLYNLLQSLPESLKKNILGLTEQTSEALKKTPQISAVILEKTRRQLVEILAKEGEIVRKSNNSDQEKFSFSEMFIEVKATFLDFFSIFKSNFHFPLFWGALCVMIFSFWDTMAITYQPLLLKEFTEGNTFLSAISGMLIILFISPVFILQIPFSRWADKYGKEKFMLLGLIISGISVIFLSQTTSIIVLIICGILSGVGYASAFSPSQAFFVDNFKKYKIKANDNNAGALRMALNFGNIFGQFFGGALFALFGFRGGFLFFGLLFFIFALFSLFFFKKINCKQGD